MRFSTRDGRVISFLIFALIGQIALLLWHLDFFTFGKIGKENNGDKPAGEIIKIENQLKRRSLESLIWQDSNATEKVFYFDSILTLKESTAQIKLENGTQISLSENTLITIEPPTKENPSEIRIQFIQGSLKSRNPYQSTKIQNEKMYLQIKENSDVEIYKNNKDSIAVQVNKGEVLLTNDLGETQLKANQFYRDENGKVSKLTKDQSLLWVEPPLSRIYSHSPKKKVEFKWLGTAQSMNLLTQGEESKKIELKSDENKMDVELSLGEHRIQLESEASVSETLTVQVWQAPLIHLVFPQPRNRHKFGKIDFIWTSHESVKEYHLKINGKNKETSRPSFGNSYEMEFNLEDDFKWSVWGEDQEGFLIPPLYEYDLYLRENPFAPPKLNSPQLIKPKIKKPNQSLYFWQNILIPIAQAQDFFEAFFSWQEMEGAHFYWIEISESIDFRKPILQKKLEKEEFIWSYYEKEKRYFWRVAAGGLDGRMGIFSEPTEVLIEQVRERPRVKVSPQKNVVPKNKEMQPVLLSQNKKEKNQTNIIKEKPIKFDEVEKQNHIMKKKKEPLVTEKKKDGPRRTDNLVNRIWLRPGYSIKNIQENSLTQAHLKGLMLMGLGYEKKFHWRKESLLNMSLKYSQANYKPDPKIEYPFQKNLSLFHVLFDFDWRNENSRLSYGGSLQFLPQVKRENFEQISESQKWAVGPQINYDSELGFLNYKGGLCLLLSDQLYGMRSNQQISYLFKNKVFLGFEAELQYLIGSDRKTQIIDSFINLGYEF